MRAPDPSNPDVPDPAKPMSEPACRTRGKRHPRLGGQQDVNGVPLPRPAKSPFREYRTLRNIRPGESPPTISPAPTATPEHRLEELRRAFAAILRRENRDPHDVVAPLMAESSGRPMKSRIAALFESHGLPPDDAQRFAEEMILQWELHEARMNTDTPSHRHGLDALVGRAVELSKGAELLRTAVIGDPQFECNRRRFVANATSVARLATNVVVIGGRSLSDLPDSLDLGESEDSALALGARVAQVANTDPAVLRELQSSGNPLHELLTATASFQEGGSELVLGIRAALAGVAYDGFHLCGLTSLMNLAYLSRRAMGERSFVQTLDAVATLGRGCDATVEDHIVTEFAELQLMPLSELLFSCRLTAASFCGKWVIEAEQSDAARRQALVDYAEMARLTELARATARGSEDKLRLLEAELVAVGEKMDLPDAPKVAYAFWLSLGPELTESVVQTIAEYETSPAMIVAVRESAHRIYPGVSFRVKA